MEHLRRLLEHLAWADARAGEALAALDDPPPDLVELYAHLIAAELVWLDRVEGVAASVPVWPATDVAGTRALAARAHERYRAHVAALTPPDLARDVRYVNSAGLAFTTSLEDILLHVALHGAYHRGQIARAIRELGGTPAPTDYVAFVRGAPAATRTDP
jgi:uncharacterized damage-inducible protein DinB